MTWQEKMERAIKINPLSHPPPASSGHCSSSVVLSDGAQAQGAQRGKEQQGRGRGSGSCSSHFIKQPGNRQRCFSQPYWAESCNQVKQETHHHWNKIWSHIKMFACDAICILKADGTLQVANYYGYSAHYHPPFFFKNPSPLLLFFPLKSNNMI